MSINMFLCSFLDSLTNAFVFLRTVAAEVRKQVSRDYGSPQMTKKRGGVQHPVSHPVFHVLEFKANRFKGPLRELRSSLG